MASMLLVGYSEKQTDQLRGALHEHRVTVARTPRESIRLMHNHSYDAVISAVQQSNDDLFDFLRTVKSDITLSSIPLILLCAEPTERSSALHKTVKAAARVLGVTHYISMPSFNAEELREKIEHCIQENPSRLWL